MATVKRKILSILLIPILVVAMCVGYFATSSIKANADVVSITWDSSDSPANPKAATGGIAIDLSTVASTDSVVITVKTGASGELAIPTNVPEITIKGEFDNTAISEAWITITNRAQTNPLILNMEDISITGPLYNGYPTLSGGGEAMVTLNCKNVKLAGDVAGNSHGIDISHLTINGDVTATGGGSSTAFSHGIRANTLIINVNSNVTSKGGGNGNGITGTNTTINGKVTAYSGDNPSGGGVGINAGQSFTVNDEGSVNAVGVSSNSSGIYSTDFSVEKGGVVKATGGDDGFGLDIIAIAPVVFNVNGTVEAIGSSGLKVSGVGTQSVSIGGTLTATATSTTGTSLNNISNVDFTSATATLTLTEATGITNTVPISKATPAFDAYSFVATGGINPSNPTTSVTSSDAPGTVSLTLTNPPIISSVTPTGTGAMLAGYIVITFNAEMDTVAGGTVALNNGGTVTSPGTWSTTNLPNDTYTIPYSGLDYDTEYNISVLNYVDVTGKTMVAVTSGRTFTTMIQDITPPIVSSVNPSDDSVPIASSTLSVTFSEEMDSAEGTVGLAPSAGAAPTLVFTSWSADKKTANYTLSGLASDTTYTYQISDFTDIAGNPMASVTSGHTFTTIADTTPPTVMSVLPSGTGAATSGTFIITFSEPMHPTYGGVLLNNLPFTVISANWTNTTTLVYKYSDLSPITSYVLNIMNFQDLAGNQMITDNLHSFTTMDETTPPEISSVEPTGTGAALSGNIAITFDKAMDPAAIGSVALNKGGTVSASGTWSLLNTVYTISYSGLTTSTEYTLSVSGFEDAVGNLMAPDTGHTFTTVMESTPPMVSSVSPSGNDVAIGTSALSITFNEDMNATPGTVSLTPSAGTAPTLTFVDWSIDNKTATYTLSGLAYDTIYTYQISDFKDLAGNTMAPVTSGPTFTTVVEPDTTPPTVSSMMPTGTDVAISGNLIITFSEPMNTSATSITVSLDGGIGTLSGGTWTNPTTYSIPYDGLVAGTSYTVTIDDFEDLAGNVMATDNSNTFTTEAVASTLTLNGAPANNTMYVGDKMTLTPTGVAGDTNMGSTGWSGYQPLFSATFSSPATFTALSPGTSTITYTASTGHSASVNITVLARGGGNTPGDTGGSTGDGANPSTADETPLGLYISLLAAIGAAFIIRRRLIKSE